MFTLGIRFLTGRSVAAASGDRDRAEWPPHPDRVFMALAAAHFETGTVAAERAALEWLEALPAPAIHAPTMSERRAVTSFVPVNDDSSPINKKDRPHATVGPLPFGRNRQPRTFPTAIPERDTVFLIWPDVTLPEEHRQAIDDLCAKVTYLGHSSSLVQLWPAHSAPEPTLVPTVVEASAHLRVSGSGRLALLEASYAAGLRPSPAFQQAYAPHRNLPEARPIPQTCFDESLIVLRKVAGQDLPLESTLALTEALRGTVMRNVPQPPTEWVSGHRPDGRPSEHDHLAYVPLPHVGSAHADGHLLGVALVLPRDISEQEANRCLAPLLAPGSSAGPNVARLVMGQVGAWELVLEDRDRPPLSLTASTWTQAATRWATATPIVLDRYPKAKDLDAAEAEAIAFVRAACVRIGLPAPVDIVLMQASVLVGVPVAGRFRQLPSRFNKARRLHTHAVLTFATKVRGPILLGAGRYRGYGLCRPLVEE